MITRHYRTHDLLLVSLFGALTAVGALMRIPLPPVPFTMQIFFALLAGMLLGPRLGALSQGLYMLLGLAGLPVFAGGGGLQYVLTPAFGYVLGFICAAWVAGAVSAAALRGAPREGHAVGRGSFVCLILAGVAGLVACYAVGVPYMYLILNHVQQVAAPVSVVVSRGLLVFLPWDVPKVLLAAHIARRVRPLLAVAAREE